MLAERDGIQIKLHCITIGDLVPEEFFQRKMESGEVIPTAVRAYWSLFPARSRKGPVYLPGGEISDMEIYTSYRAYSRHFKDGGR